MHFCLDQADIQKNWDEVVERIKLLTRSWKQHCLTEVGRSNIIKAQLLPIISFVGTTLSMPVRYEKQLSTAIHQFLWAGKAEKEQRALSIKPRGEGGLSIPISDQASQQSGAAGYNECKKSRESSAWHSKTPTLQ
jgi:hypothetical protein